MDYYATLIRQRTAAEAASLLADECRKKDTTIAVLEERLATTREALADAEIAVSEMAERFAELRPTNKEIQLVVKILREIAGRAQAALKGVSLC